MDLVNSNFRYTVVLKIVQNSGIELIEVLPNASEVSLSSRDFLTYNECVSSCKGLLQDIVDSLNKPKKIFKLGAEVNPILSGQQSISKDWVEDEVSRFWVYDQSQEGVGAKIDSVARTCIYAVPKVSHSNLN